MTATEMDTAERGGDLSPVRQGPGRLLPLRLAARQMRGGLGGFVVFILCVALGVMVIAAIGGLANALILGLESQGRQIIGGDIAISRMHARAKPEERAALERLGQVSETSTMRVMARVPGGKDQALAELKSADGAYPLIGEMVLRDGVPLADALARGAIIEPILLERLNLSVGDTIELGSAQVPVAGVIEKEPDGLLDRLTYGPRVLVSNDTLVDSGLASPGSLIRWRYAVALDGQEAQTEAALNAARQQLAKDLAAGGFTVVDRADPSPQVRRTLERLKQFLTLIGLTALIVGGVGVANAVANYVDRKRRTIATMKSLGGGNRTILSIFLVQILAITLVGIALGLAAGLAIPALLKAAYGAMLPIPAVVTISWTSLLSAAGYGLLVAVLFSLWPLGKAETISPAVLFRDQVGQDSARPRWPIVIATAATAGLIAAIAVLTSETPKIALYFAGAMLAILAVFYGLGYLTTIIARRIPRPKQPELALALGAIAAPGGLARTVVLSLGAGLSMLVAVALTDASLVKELTSKLPENAPDYFVLDIQRGDLEGFRKTVLDGSPQAKIEDAPMLRGRIVEVKGVPTGELKVAADAEWVLRGDRGITYAAEIPQGSRVVEGEWWGADYAGEPLVSFEAELGRALGLGIGDELTVNVLGRNITARVANFRELDWDSLSINFVMVFSPNTLAGAPNNLLATVSLPEDIALTEEAAVMRQVSQRYPTVTAIRVRDAVDAFNEVFGRIMTAIRVAGGVTLIAGALVLAGALATAQRRRIMEAVILKALGATQARILGAHLIEYLLLALVTAGFAILLGGAAAYIAVEHVIDVTFVASWSAVAQAIGIAVALVLVFGGFGTWQVLRARPVPYLKSE